MNIMYTYCSDKQVVAQHKNSCFRLSIGLLLVIMCALPLQVYAQLDLDKTEGAGELLKKDLDELLDVSYSSATGKTERIFTSPLSATVLTAEEIHRAGVTNIPEALRLIPGLIVREKTPGVFDVHIRGFDALDPGSFVYQTENSISLVMLDNRPLNFETNGSVYWNAIPIGINEIARIEVIRGPAPAQYMNPASGIIHIITKKPLESMLGPTASVTAYSTMNDIANVVSGSMVYNFGQTAIRVAGGYEHRHRFKVDYWKFTVLENKLLGVPYMPGRFVDMPSDTVVNYAGFAYNSWLTGSGTGAEKIKAAYPEPDLSLNNWNTNIDIQSTIGGVDSRVSAGTNYALSQNAGLDNATYLLSTSSHKSWFTRGVFSYSNISVSADYTYTGIEPVGVRIGDMEVGTLNTMLEYNKEISDNLFLQAGASYRNSQTGGKIIGADSLDFSTGKFLSGQSAITNALGAMFARVDYTVNQFRFVGALRVERYKDPAVFNWLPQFSVTYTPADNLALRATVSRGSRAPFTITLYSNYNAEFTYQDSITNKFGIGPPKLHLTSRVKTLGNTDLKLLTIDNYDVGVRWNIIPELYAEIESYYMILHNPTVHVLEQNYQDLSELMTKSKVIDYSIFKYSTQEYTDHLFGATSSIVWQPSKQFSIQGNIAFQSSWLENYRYRNQLTGVVSDTVISSVHNTATPTLLGGFGVNYAPISGLDINLNGYFYGSQILKTRYDSFEVESNLLCNLNVGYEVMSNIKFTVTARNILGSNKRQFGAADVINTFVTAGIQASF